MTAQTPMWNQNLNLGTANMLRHMNAGLVGGKTYETISAGAANLHRGHGVLSEHAFEVLQQPTANNTVRVSPGFAMVRGTNNDAQGSYYCALDSYETLTLANKDASLTRYDLIVAVVQDDDYAGSLNNWDLQVITGTPGSGLPTLTEDTLLLAQVTVAPGTGPTIITQGAIDDNRYRVVTPGGILPVPTSSATPSPKNWDVIWDLSDSQFKLYFAGSWYILGRNLDANWVTYTPLLPTVTLGSGGSSFGRYQKFGKTVIGIAGFQLGTGGSISGSALTVSTPSTSANPGGTNLKYMAYARAYLGPSGYAAGVFWSATAEIDPNTSTLSNFATAGTAGWKSGIPASWTQGAAHLQVFFNYEEP